MESFFEERTSFIYSGRQNSDGGFRKEASQTEEHYPKGAPGQWVMSELIVCIYVIKLRWATRKIGGWCWISNKSWTFIVKNKKKSIKKGRSEPIWTSWAANSKRMRIVSEMKGKESFSKNGSLWTMAFLNIRNRSKLRLKEVEFSIIERRWLRGKEGIWRKPKKIRWKKWPELSRNCRDDHMKQQG